MMVLLPEPEGAEKMMQRPGADGWSERMMVDIFGWRRDFLAVRLYRFWSLRRHCRVQ